MSDLDLSCLRGRRVLVAEDEMMIALLIAEVLEDHGCKIIGPFANVAPALEALAYEKVDVALLDINLGTERSNPIAEALEKLDIPFFLLSGHGSTAEGIKEDWTVLPKPFAVKELLSALASVEAR